MGTDQVYPRASDGPDGPSARRVSRRRGGARSSGCANRPSPTSRNARRDDDERAGSPSCSTDVGLASSVGRAGRAVVGAGVAGARRSRRSVALTIRRRRVGAGRRLRRHAVGAEPARRAAADAAAAAALGRAAGRRRDGRRPAAAAAGPTAPVSALRAGLGAGAPPQPRRGLRRREPLRSPRSTLPRIDGADATRSPARPSVVSPTASGRLKRVAGRPERRRRAGASRDGRSRAASSAVSV